MRDNIETALIGRLGQEPELRKSAAGRPWTRLSVAVGVGEEAQWVCVSAFGEDAQRLCEAFHKGDKVYVEGTLRLSERTGKGGEKRTGLSVAAWKAEKLGAIGRNNPRRPSAPPPQGIPAQVYLLRNVGGGRKGVATALHPTPHRLSLETINSRTITSPSIGTGLSQPPGGA
jgi:single-stranded DNA-binding protein